MVCLLQSAHLLLLASSVASLLLTVPSRPPRNAHFKSISPYFLSRSSCGAAGVESSQSLLAAGTGAEARNASFTLEREESRPNRWFGRLKLRRWRSVRSAGSAMSRYRYNYCYDELVLGDDREEVTLAPGRTTAVVLVQPIGVGIGRWYYGRLLISLREEFDRIRNNAGGSMGPE